MDKLDYLKRDSHGAVELTTSDTFSFLYENMRVRREVWLPVPLAQRHQANPAALQCCTLAICPPRSSYSACLYTCVTKQCLLLPPTAMLVLLPRSCHNRAYPQVINGEVCFRTSVRSVVQEVYSARAKLHEVSMPPPLCFNGSSARTARCSLGLSLAA